MTKRTPIIAAVALAISAAGGVATAVALVDDNDDTIVMGSGTDRLPSTTAVDWVTYADYVVVVKPVREEEIPPAESEVERGEGLIGREVTLRVEDTVWASPQVTRERPTRLEWNAIGWVFDGDPEDQGDREVMAMEDTSRLELGHSYVVAISWEPERCSAGDEREPGYWALLGGGAVVPYDGTTLGQGEVEGRNQKAADVDPEAGPVEVEVQDKVLGGSIADLKAVLAAAEPVEREVFSVPAPCN